jgi:hypothetical protein
MMYSPVVKELACCRGGEFWTAVRSTFVGDPESCEGLSEAGD